MAAPVDEERGRARDAGGETALHVALHARGVGVRVELGREAIDVQTDFPGIAQQLLVLERLLAVEEEVVQLPEAPLGAGGLDRLGAVLRVWMDLAEREVAVNEMDQLGNRPLELLDAAIRAARVRALVIAVNEQRRGRLRPALVLLVVAQIAPPAASGAIGSASPAPPGFSREMNSSSVIGKSRTRSATSSSSVMVATSSTCSLRNHCTNCSLR